MAIDVQKLLELYKLQAPTATLDTTSAPRAALADDPSTAAAGAKMPPGVTMPKFVESLGQMLSMVGGTNFDQSTQSATFSPKIAVGVSPDIANKAYERQLAKFNAEAAVRESGAKIKLMQAQLKNEQDQAELARQRFGLIEKPTADANISKLNEENLASKQNREELARTAPLRGAALVQNLVQGEAAIKASEAATVNQGIQAEIGKLDRDTYMEKWKAEKDRLDLAANTERIRASAALQSAQNDNESLAIQREQNNREKELFNDKLMLQKQYIVMQMSGLARDNMKEAMKSRGVKMDASGNVDMASIGTKDIATDYIHGKLLDKANEVVKAKPNEMFGNKTASAALQDILNFTNFINAPNPADAQRARLEAFLNTMAPGSTQEAYKEAAKELAPAIPGFEVTSPTSFQVKDPVDGTPVSMNLLPKDFGKAVASLLEWAAK